MLGGDSSLLGGSLGLLRESSLRFCLWVNGDDSRGKIVFEESVR